MFKLFQQMHKPNTTLETSSPDLKLAKKLNYQNSTTWCKLMQIALEGMGRLSHITDAPLSTSDPTYQTWKQRDSIILSWIISNIDTELINQFLDHTVARDLWRGIKVLLCSGRDELQIFDLSSKASALKQNQEPIEIFLWETDHNLKGNESTNAEPNDTCKRYNYLQHFHPKITFILVLGRN